MADFGAPVRGRWTIRKRYMNARWAIWQSGDYAGARVDFASLVERFPSHKMAGHAQYWLGETFYVQRQYKQAAQAFWRLYDLCRQQKPLTALLKLGMMT